jgi:Glyoxalase-like domain
MRLDHLSYAAGPEGLASCVQRLGSHLAAAFSDGGLHPSFGTRNFVLPLKNGCYLEVVDVLDHPAADKAPFGQAVRARSRAGGGWLGWAIRVDDITAVESRLGRRAVSGHRRRPDGVDLRWKQIGIKDLAVDPQRPFFVQWQTGDHHHPSVGASAITLTSLEFAGDEETVDAYLGVSSSQPLDGIEVVWELPSEDETGVVAAVFETPNGPVRLD